MSRSRLLGIDINRLQLYGIFLGITVGCRSSKIFDLGIGFQNFKRLAGKNFRSGSYPSAVFPLLNFPIGKYLCGIARPRSGAGRGFGFINIRMRIYRSSGTTIGIVFHYDTGSTFQSRMPLCIDVELRGDPETVSAVVAGGIRVTLRIDQITVIIIGICHIDRLVIRRRYVRFVDHIRFAVEHLCAGFIEIPAIKCIASQISAGRFTDVAAFADTEGHLLVIGTPVDITGRTFRIVYMQEYTVLFLTPFGIDSNTAFGHLVEGVFLRARAVNKPAFKDVARWSMRSIRCIRIIGRYICTIGNTSLGCNLAHTSFFKRIVITVYILAIHEVDDIGITSIITLYCRSTTASPCTRVRINAVFGITGQL